MSSRRKKIEDSYEENASDDDDEGEEQVASEEEGEGDEDDGKAKKRKFKSPSKGSSSSSSSKSHPITQLPYSDRIFILYNKNNDDNNKVAKQSNTTKSISKGKHIISLPHPKTSQESRFILDCDTNTILEINNFNQKPSSWFINDSVRYDGSLYITTPIDPMFIIIQYMDKVITRDKDKFVTLTMMRDDPTYSRLFQKGYKFDEDQIMMICDWKDLINERFFKLNQDKLLRWLQCKVTNISSYLKQSNINIYSASTLIKQSTKIDSNPPEETWKLMAIDFIGEYLNDKYLSILSNAYGNLSIKSISSIINNTKNDQSTTTTTTTTSGSSSNSITGINPLDLDASIGAFTATTTTPPPIPIGEFKLGSKKPASSLSSVPAPTIKKSAKAKAMSVAPKSNSLISSFFVKKE